MEQHNSKIHLPFDKIYCLLSPSNIERSENVTNQINKIENDVEVFNTIYIPNVYSIAHTLSTNLLFKWNKQGNGTAVNCALNHYTMIKQAYELGMESIMIFEDDVEFNNNIEYINNVLCSIPNDWDCIRFSWIYTIDCDKLPDISDILYYKCSNKMWGTQCYALNRTGMCLYLKLMESNFGVADLPLYNIGNYCNMYFCTCNICKELNFSSTIQNN